MYWMSYLRSEDRETSRCELTSGAHKFRTRPRKREFLRERVLQYSRVLKEHTRARALGLQPRSVTSHIIRSRIARATDAAACTKA